MRKINWIVGSVALGLGMAIGIVGYAVATTPATGNSLLTKFGAGKETQVLSDGVQSTDSVLGNSNPDLNVDPLTPSEGVLTEEIKNESTVEGLNQKIIQ